MNILLDYFFPISSINATPAASTAYLKQVLAIVKPKMGAVADTPTLCVQKTDVDAFSTTNLEVDELFDAGLSRVFVMASDDLTLVGTHIAGHENDFFTILISSDFSDAEIDAMALGAVFKGVVGMASTDDSKNTTRAAVDSHAAFHCDGTNHAKNMFYAFGKMLSNPLNWKNQQYIQMSHADDVATVGAAKTLFDARISFVLNDTQYGSRLGLFAAGGKAIVAPYIERNLQIDFQSAALTYISGNQPSYTKKEAALLEDELKKVIQSYVDRKWIDSGVVTVSLVDSNFNAAASINIAEPKALWRVLGQMQQTL